MRKKLEEKALLVTIDIKGLILYWALMDFCL